VQVNSMFSEDELANLDVHIPNLLEAGVRVLVYSGVEDLICNWYGGNAWTSALPWSGTQEFNALPLKQWTGADGQTAAGQGRSYGPFTFLNVYAAGHMVPLDQPANALMMINKFVNNEPFF